MGAQAGMDSDCAGTARTWCGFTEVCLPDGRHWRLRVTILWDAQTRFLGQWCQGSLQVQPKDSKTQYGESTVGVSLEASLIRSVPCESTNHNVLLRCANNLLVGPNRIARFEVSIAAPGDTESIPASPGNVDDISHIVAL